MTTRGILNNGVAADTVIVDKQLWKRCIFRKDGVPQDCPCQPVLVQSPGSDTFLDTMDYWQGVLSRLKEDSSRFRDQSDPKRLFNRRGRLSSLSPSDCSDESIGANSPTCRNSAWADAPVFVPASPPPYRPISNGGLQSFEQFIKLQEANSRVGYAALHYHRSNGGSSGDRNFKKGYISSGRSSSASSLPHHRKPCAFCVRTGRDKSMYDSHMLRNPITNHVMCPELKKYPLCYECGDTGDDNVHMTYEHHHFAHRQKAY